MTHPSASWPLDNRAHLEAALREQGMASEEVVASVDALAHLTSWPAPVPDQADTERLMQRLHPLLPARSLVRQALQERPRTLWGECLALLSLVRAQVGVLRPAFWLSSAVVMLLGALMTLGIAVPQSLALAISGPLLSYLGTTAAFRGAALGLLEFELACPPSPRQLMVARLVLVLGYDVGLGLLGSCFLWRWSGPAPLALTLSWLAPLLLIAGLTLLLSLRLPMMRAAGLAYAGWLAALALRWTSAGADGLLFAMSTEVLLGCAGLALLAAAVYAAPAAGVRLLPHH